MVKLKNGGNGTFDPEAFKAWEQERHQSIVNRAIKNKAKRDRTRKFMCGSKPPEKVITYFPEAIKP